MYRLQESVEMTKRKRPHATVLLRREALIMGKHLRKSEARWATILLVIEFVNELSDLVANILDLVDYLIEKIS